MLKISLASTINNNQNETRGDSAHSNETDLRETNEMDGDGRTVDERQTVKFLNQGQDAGDQSVPMAKEIHPSYLNLVMTDKNHSINDFLERPVRIWNGSFSTSDTRNQVLYTARFPDILLANKMYNEKIQGFVGMRPGAVEVRVQVNAQKFQQGRLRLQYIPYAKYLQEKVTMYGSSLTTRTSCPGVDIDICGGSTPATMIAQAVFTIPYVSPHLYFNLINGDGTMGDINLFVYSPLTAGTNESDSCEVTVWARFIEPKLAFPTGAPSMYQVPTRRHVAQIAGEATSLQSTGVISNTLGKVSETLDAASDLPVIGKFLNIPAWVSGAASGIAKLFGFSKPTTTMDTKLRTTNCFANFNGKDSSHKMAFSGDNEIDTPEGLAGTRLDEMAISTVASTPAFWQNFSWDTSQTVEDQVLWTDQVTPLKFSQIAGTTAYSILPVGFIANCFGLWRGSLVYTFKVVKTGFHAGRLRIYYTPYENPTNITPGAAPLTEIEKNYQVVLDIAENDVVSFTVPYVSTKPWLSVTNQSSAQLPVPIATGYVVVTVLNELKAVSSVSTSLDILVEISGGPDLTFALPSAPRLQPTLTLPPTPTLRHKAEVFGTSIQQQRNEAQMLNYPETISTLNPVTNWSPEAHCIGEKVTSLRQMIKRNNFVGMITNRRGTATTNPSVAQDYSTFASINPYGLKINDLTHGLDYLSYFGSIYAFFRGGIRIKFTTQTSGAQGFFLSTDAPNGIWYDIPSDAVQMFVRMFNSYDQLHGAISGSSVALNNVVGKIGINAIAMSTLNAALTDSSSTSIVSQRIEGLTEIEVPYYNSTHLSPASMKSALFPGSSDTDDSYPLPIIVAGPTPCMIADSVSSGANSATLDQSYITTSMIYRSAADDFSFASMIGVPPMVVGNNISSTIFTPTVLP